MKNTSSLKTLRHSFKAFLRNFMATKNCGRAKVAGQLCNRRRLLVDKFDFIFLSKPKMR